MRRASCKKQLLTIHNICFWRIVYLKGFMENIYTREAMRNVHKTDMSYLEYLPLLSRQHFICFIISCGAITCTLASAEHRICSLQWLSWDLKKRWSTIFLLIIKHKCCAYLGIMHAPGWNFLDFMLHMWMLTYDNVRNIGKCIISILCSIKNNPGKEHEWEYLRDHNLIDSFGITE